MGGKTRRIECLGCGSSVEFSAGQVEQPCGTCEVMVPMPVRVGSDIPEHDMRNPLGDPDCSGRTVRRCTQCSAAVSGKDRTLERCPFCRGRLASVDDASTFMWPDGVLPHLLSRRQARDNIRDELARLEMADEVGRLAAVYCPWWILSWEVQAPYTGQQGLHETYEESPGVVRRRTVWSPWSGVFERPWTGIQIPGSIGIRSNAARRLSPWDYAFVEAYDPANIAGSLCEHTAVTPLEVMKRNGRAIHREVHREVKRSFGGDLQIIETVDVNIEDERYRLLLVPVWAGRLATGESVAVNARTGEVVVEGQAARQVTDDDVLEVPDEGLSKILWAVLVGGIVVGVLYWLAG